VKKLLTWLLCALSIAVPALAQAPATDGKPVHNINLTEARDVADAAAINTAISILVKDARSCPAVAKNQQACACSFKDDLKKLKSAYDDAVAKHPGWNDVDAVVAYIDAATGKSVTLYLRGVKRQLDACAQHER
jgi:hypothetical protein